jgi:hypothetical protein
VIAASFFFGVIVGAALLILVALWLAARPKPEQETHQRGVSAVSVSMGGNQQPAEVQIDKQILTKILKAYGADKFFELPPMTRH